MADLKSGIRYCLLYDFKRGNTAANLIETYAMLLDRTSSLSSTASDGFRCFALGMKASKMTHAVGLHRWLTWSSRRKRSKRIPVRPQGIWRAGLGAVTEKLESRAGAVNGYPTSSSRFHLYQPNSSHYNKHEEFSSVSVYEAIYKAAILGIRTYTSLITHSGVVRK
ncbi:hypothetical protein Y032_0054g2468 [Ancylostoma ceylanicum]|uniref:Mos1 transposase HTH domain-containing protein n=1 Tax=Ancylostoma ceylanicum TaxID=53326 RepID=A0A016U5P9_9BILA|nr:hypothetical protein Y032_0054g2468 [Ancylostoma ceylanicum]